MGIGSGGLIAWLKDVPGKGPGLPGAAMHVDDAASLIAPLFDRLSSLVVAHAAPLSLCAYVAARIDAQWPLYFLLADVVLLLARIWVVISIRRRGNPSSEALLRAALPYFAIGVAWAVVTGAFCFLCYVALDDEASRVLAVTLAMGTVGGIASRNAATPRFALAQIAALLLPQALGGALHGSWHWVQTAFVLVYFVALCSIVRRHYLDVRRIMDAQREKAALAARFDAALTNMGQGLTLYDAEGRLRVVNPRFREIFGFPRDAALTGMSAAQLAEALSIRGVPDAAAWATPAATAGERSTLELPDGRCVALSREPMPDGGWVATFEDVTERQEAEARARHMARHDSLTGLPNRTLFQERLESAVARLSSGGAFGVLYLDLDHFKEVNDSLGHAVGDRLLMAVADRLRLCLRPGDMIARLGGDEFAAIIEGAPAASAVAQLAERLAGEVGAEYLIDGKAVLVGVSVGIALAPRDGASADLLLRHADMALYEAKGAGRGTHRFFDWIMSSRLQARRDMEAELRAALARDELELFYQPQVAATGGVVGFEALVRWRHPERGLVSPAEFIPVAEESGLIVPLGEWVLRTACAEAMRWPEPVRVGVNLSAAQFAGRDLHASVLAALQGSGLPAERLELEITEAVVLKDSPEVVSTLRRIRALGVRVALDDFGTGYSSIAYLRSFPLDKIKIDRSFVRDVAHSESAAAIVRAISMLGATLGLTLNAEGVETDAQLAQLRRLGCAELQGFLFSAPRPAHDVPQLLRELAVCRQPSLAAGEAVTPFLPMRAGG
ncbi:EAL domain-containing protein [Roseomonas sp. SSH11]|uniref:EAL domain-containing protein n=1 Tax=Pararoseomonas baculiformis TaxID=2820812 RepID=A0ABS4AE35_9PROT|nr:EAL domain-containing protein [Pararoseomonas baculiformis]MBP0445279.1 EAL domain-containing protein [Pararoseomonas baculiformis]